MSAPLTSQIVGQCPCIDALADVDELRNLDGSIPFDDFSDMRNKCQALRDVLLPDSIWPQFRDWHARPDNEAGHRSILLLAFRRGCLRGITKPIHRFVLSHERILPEVRKQYVQDLRERWMLTADPVERNRRSRIFRGHLIELQFALWLEGQSDQIVGLEATRAGPDIETSSPGGVHNSFEVKFIGMEDCDFSTFVESMAGLPAGRWVSPYTAINYMLFRIYEAAHQLRAAAGTKTVVVVVDDVAWFRFEMQLKGNWIDWTNPAFVSPDAEWTQFLDEQQKRYPDLPTDVASTVQEVDSITIFRQTSRSEFILEYEIALTHPV